MSNDVSKKEETKEMSLSYNPLTLNLKHLEIKDKTVENYFNQIKTIENITGKKKLETMYKNYSLTSNNPRCEKSKTRFYRYLLCPGLARPTPIALYCGGFRTFPVERI